MIPIYKPYLPKYSLKYVHEAIDSGWISSEGKYKNLCEELIKDLFGYKYVLLVNNGTSATYLVSKCLNYKHPEFQTILVPNNVYVASWNSFLYDKKFRLIVCDIDLDTWNILEDDIQRVIDPVLIVHNVGNIFNVPKLKRKYPNIVIVEDNCEGFLGKYESKYSGTESLCSSISFFANKNVTSGEGGLFCTNDEELYEYANLIHGQGQSKDRYIHSILGNNFRMTNIQAALLYGQLLILDEIIEKKKELFDYYRKNLEIIDCVRFQKEDKNCCHSNWMFALRIIGNHNYNDVYEFFSRNGIETRPFFYPIDYHDYLKHNHHKMNHFKQILPNSELLSQECFMIPSYPELTKQEQNYIIKTIEDYCKTI